MLYRGSKTSRIWRVEPVKVEACVTGTASFLKLVKGTKHKREKGDLRFKKTNKKRVCFMSCGCVLNQNVTSLKG